MPSTCMLLGNFRTSNSGLFTVLQATALGPLQMPAGTMCRDARGRHAQRHMGALGALGTQAPVLKSARIQVTHTAIQQGKDTGLVAVPWPRVHNSTAQHHHIREIQINLKSNK